MSFRRISTFLTLPCLCVNQRCCVSKLRQLYAPQGRLLMFPARSFVSSLHITNSHATSITRRRSSASVGAPAQYTSMLPAKQDKDTELCIVFPNVLHVNSLVFICSYTSGLSLPTRQLSSVTSRTSHVSFRAPLRSYSSLPYLPSVSYIASLSLGCTFLNFSTRPPPNEATPVLD